MGASCVIGVVRVRAVEPVAAMYDQTEMAEVARTEMTPEPTPVGPNDWPARPSIFGELVTPVEAAQYLRLDETGAARFQVRGSDAELVAEQGRAEGHQVRRPRSGTESWNSIDSWPRKPRSEGDLHPWPADGKLIVYGQSSVVVPGFKARRS